MEKTLDNLTYSEFKQYLLDEAVQYGNPAVKPFLDSLEYMEYRALDYCDRGMIPEFVQVGSTPDGVYCNNTSATQPTKVS